MIRRLGAVAFLGLLALLATAVGRSAAADDESNKRKPVGQVPDPETAQKALRVLPGFKVDLFAAEPNVANIVAFHADEKGRFYVVETFRHSDGVTDTRGHMNWLVDDLAARTVSDRVAMYRKFFTLQEFADYRVEHDRIRLVEDRDGDGKADHAEVFADGFNLPETGIGAGVLARKGDVYFTCIPDLWMLKDTNGDGKADVRKLLHNGYGVHVGFLGHDLHGLIFGPDGKLYFSIGDRGFNVKTLDGKELAVIDTGSVLRCEPDGTNLEVVATGLRNPQELAFNDSGDLFTVDNNSDGGDKARFVHIVEGGDSGWRIGFQFINKPNARGVWNSEKMWTPEWDGKPAYMIPPIINFADGPSGLTYYPGVGLNDGELGRFYLSDFRGAAATSGVRSFLAKPKGASFELADPRQFLWGLQATDCDFAPDGALYVSDWIKGWDKTGKGRIWRVSDPSAASDPRVAETRKLIAEGFDGRSDEELGRLLSYPDRRVRQEAQFTLADRAKAGRGNAQATLVRVAQGADANHSRFHGVWGIGQVLRGSDDARRRELSPVLLALLKDSDADVRAQAARASTEWTATPPAAILPLVQDENPRVRLFAMLSLARLAPSAEVVGPIMDRIAAGDGLDPYLRHAAVFALARAAEDAKARERIVARAGDSSVEVRMAVLLTMRRLDDPAVARFLDDAVPAIVLEAARCITERPGMEQAIGKLAAMATKANLSEALWRRVLTASEGFGRSEADPRPLAAIAARSDVPESIRVEALGMLAKWGEPSALHPLTGLWRGESKRSAEPAVAAMTSALPKLVSGSSNKVRSATAAAVAELKVADAGPSLRGLAADVSLPAGSRVEALRALDALKDENLAESVAAAMKDQAGPVRSEGLRILARLEPERAVDEASTVLQSGAASEKQAAFATLGSIPGAKSDAVLAKWLTKLQAGELPPEVRLDLTEAVAKREAAEVKKGLAGYEALRDSKDPLAAYRDALAGGDAERGRQIFREKAEVQCMRCHKVSGDGGEVGPELAGIGRKKGREYVLESIVIPNKQIAQGFETQVIARENGQVVAGIVKSEDEKEVRLVTAEGNTVVIPKSEIEEKARGASAMPEDIIKDLSKPEIRDLVEFLSTTEPFGQP
ncbi:PVC-type heme-binding CxxCH protein [Paludisphaera rhizosphaerae]|uniref:PVC-type heme-binding CxxCH protein n=1 Tax=Paludisphaera rhizosphaerae TaxID=2711216 RepID=UPI0013E9D344|nr:PVC-type heme-binding CxxCH protein [Paludisphaera rhizosphaerae]